MKRFLHLIIHELGFDSADHFFRSVIGIKTTSFILLQISGSAITVAFTFIDQWIWSPPHGLIVIIVLIMIKNITSTYVAIKIKKEKFRLQKFYNIAPEIVAALTLLTFAFNIGNLSLILSWLPAAVFGWFTAFNFLTLGKNLIALKLVKGEFMDYLVKRLNIEDKELSDSITKQSTE